MPETACRGVGRLAHVNPVWLFMLAVVVLAILSMFGLARSDINEGLVGTLCGAWICVMVGFAFWIWRTKELQP